MVSVPFCFHEFLQGLSLLDLFFPWVRCIYGLEELVECHPASLCSQLILCSLLYGLLEAFFQILSFLDHSVEFGSFLSFGI